MNRWEKKNDEARRPPKPEARLGTLGPTMETLRDINGDKAVVPIGLSCNYSDMSKGETLAREEREVENRAAGDGFMPQT